MGSEDGTGPGTGTVSFHLNRTININMHINIERWAPCGGFAPKPPRLRRDRIFFTRGPDAVLILNPPPRYRLRFRLEATRHRRGQTLEPLLEQGSSPVKRSSSRARVPQGLLKPSSRRVKESFTGSLRLVQLKDIQNVSIWSTI